MELGQLVLSQLEDEARTHLIAGRDEQAYQHIQQMINRDPRCENAYYLLSILARKYHNYGKELEMLDIAQGLNKQHIGYQVFSARALAMLGESDTAKRQLDALDKSKIVTAELLEAMASTYNKLYLYAEACRWFAALVECDQSNPHAFFNLGTCYKFCGQFNQAQQAFAKAIELKPDYYKAHAALSAFASGQTRPEVVDNLVKLLRQNNDLDANLHLSHALSKEYDAQQDYQASFESLLVIKQQMKVKLKYQFAQDAQLFQCIEQTFAALTEYAAVDKVSDIFVVGMPRTGTTLVERLLSAHPSVVSGGELYHFNMAFKKVLAVNDKRFTSCQGFKRTTPDVASQIGEVYKKATSYLHQPSDILLNKLPLNILYAEQILASLPNAVIVCLDRHPMDTIVSNFRQLFSFDDRANLYSLDLVDTAQYTVAFKQLVHKLQQRWGQRFYVVNYENMVTQPQQEARRLYQFCGLAWHDDYLAIEKNTQPVATASSVQVREKIHAKSLAQWRRYESFLNDAKDVLNRHNIPF